VVCSKFLLKHLVFSFSHMHAFSAPIYSVSLASGPRNVCTIPSLQCPDQVCMTRSAWLIQLFGAEPPSNAMDRRRRHSWGCAKIQTMKARENV
jgi:hypothetical protein